MVTPALELRDLGCVRGGRALFSELNLSRAGRPACCACTGANGAGKTSLLRMVCGLLTPGARRGAAGAARASRTLREEFHRQLVYLGHAAALKDDLTALENLLAAARLAGGRARSTRPRRALHARRPARPRALCRCARCRRASAGASRWRGWCSAATAALWVLDEPFNALDAAAAAWLRGLVAAHVARGGVVRADQPPDRPRAARRGMPQTGARAVNTIAAARHRARGRRRAARRGAASSRATCASRCAGAPTRWPRCSSSSIVVSLFPLGVGPEPALLRTHGAGRGVGGRAAGVDAVAAAPVRRRPAGRHARAAAAVRHAAAAAGARQGGRALAVLGPAAGAGLAAAGAAVRPVGAMRSACWRLSLLLGTPVLSLVGAHRRGAHAGRARRRRAAVAAGAAAVRAGADLRRRRGRCRQHRRRRGRAPLAARRAAGAGAGRCAAGRRPRPCGSRSNEQGRIAMALVVHVPRRRIAPRRSTGSPTPRRSASIRWPAS